MDGTASYCRHALHEKDCREGAAPDLARNVALVIFDAEEQKRAASSGQATA
jgi:hypothetical protein